MNVDAVKPVVDAVLYEGYILYPYRQSSAKNRQRWTFGGIYPEVYADANDHAEPAEMHTECLIEGAADCHLAVSLRFLQPTSRQVLRATRPQSDWPPDDSELVEVPNLDVGGERFQSWQEAVERDVRVFDGQLHDLIDDGRHATFGFSAQREMQPLRADGLVQGALCRQHAALRGEVTVSLEAVAKNAWRLSVHTVNSTRMDPKSVVTRDQASLYSFASTHTILGSRDAAFVSMTEPPAGLADAVAACRNDGAWPVLVGEPGARDIVLCSPIVLYDYPEIAAESPGDLFDATEVDEILSLNILAMTDDEKREMQATDPRAAALLERTEALDADDFMRLHGVLRRPRDTTPGLPAGPTLVWYNQRRLQLQVGDPVRLHPKSGGDVMDLVLDGKRAVIEAIETDFEDRIHVAVAIDDDPGRDWGLQRMPGHRFFFSPEEIEPVGEGHGAGASP